jgi:ABC-type multidrug transport system fused ATPase/permease subunit
MMAFLDVVGLISVMPFLALLGNPESLHNNSLLFGVYKGIRYFGINSTDEILFVLGIISFLLILVSSSFRIFANYKINMAIEMLRLTLGTRTLKITLSRPYIYFLDKHSGDLSKSVLADVDQAIINVIRPVINMVAYTFVLLAIILVLFIVSPKITILTGILYFSLYAIIFKLIKKKLSYYGDIITNQNGKRFVASNEAFTGIKIIKMLNCEDSYVKHFEKPSLTYCKNTANYQTTIQIPNYLIEAVIFGTLLLISLVLMSQYGGAGTKAFSQVLPTLGLFAFAAYRLKSSLQFIFNGFSSIRYGKAIVKKLHDVTFDKSSVSRLSCNHIRKIFFNKFIEIKNLSFTYPNTGKLSVDNINFRIAKGTSIGIVGSTGAGKTTLVDITLGLLRPQKGGINVDGVVVDDETIASWQALLGYVPQEIFLTDSSIYENIAFGIPFNQIDKSKVIECAKMAQIHNFINEELENGYETFVGERGVRLSGGQRQRIGIARSLYNDPEILVFDEATSALDGLTEKSVMHAIEKLAGKKTIIIIAHRIGTVKNCDQIVYLENGKTLATGNFEGLINSSDKFKQMALSSL